MEYLHKKSLCLADVEENKMSAIRLILGEDILKQIESEPRISYFRKISPDVVMIISLTTQEALFFQKGSFSPESSIGKYCRYKNILSRTTQHCIVYRSIEAWDENGETVNPCEDTVRSFWFNRLPDLLYRPHYQKMKVGSFQYLTDEEEEIILTEQTEQEEED